jgi:hypothetical protein
MEPLPTKRKLKMKNRLHQSAAILKKFAWLGLLAFATLTGLRSLQIRADANYRAQSSLLLGNASGGASGGQRTIKKPSENRPA